MRPPMVRAGFAPLEFEDLELAESRHQEIGIRLVAAGACRTDTAIRDQEIVPMRHRLLSAVASRNDNQGQVRVRIQTRSTRTP
jgi:D-arabinose 1-dehydrogenase-like Zn-dependent alcohol dehydrogenase